MIWTTLDNSDESETLKQHCYTSKSYDNICGDQYEGNVSLCGLVIASNGDRYLKIEELESEQLNYDSACKTCLTIYNKEQ